VRCTSSAQPASAVNISTSKATKKQKNVYKREAKTATKEKARQAALAQRDQEHKHAQITEPYRGSKGKSRMGGGMYASVDKNYHLVFE
jgi:hypothetical protein